MTGKPAAFLDRDGVLNERPPEHEYVRDAADLRLLGGAAAAAVALQRAGYALVVVSNQRGIARKLVTWDALSKVEERIQEALGKEGGRIEAFYYCPHETDAGCDCRKPGAGLLLRAADECGLDLDRSVLIGDMESDIDAGRGAGVFTVRLGCTAGQTAADLVAEDLPAAVELVLTRSGENAGLRC
jgi:D-glycero-D-manno-heptose 1,7-bisphosphate phosphatase